VAVARASAHDGSQVTDRWAKRSLDVAGALIAILVFLPLLITIGLLSLIKLGTAVFDSEAIGNSIAFTAFALCLIVAAVECRNETGTALTTATFDSKQMNWAILAEVVLAVAVTQIDGFRRMLGTAELNLKQFAWALVPAVALLILWEAGKLVARWRIRTRPPAVTSAAGTRTAP